MEINKALFELQEKGLELRKDSTNPHFGNTYASLGAVLDLIIPELTERSILLTQAPQVLEGEGPVLTTILTPMDDEGSPVVVNTPLVLDKATMQGLGSAITYARRYALVSIFGLDAEDDDGNEASGIKATTVRSAPTRRRS